MVGETPTRWGSPSCHGTACGCVSPRPRPSPARPSCRHLRSAAGGGHGATWGHRCGREREAAPCLRGLWVLPRPSESRVPRPAPAPDLHCSLMSCFFFQIKLCFIMRIKIPFLPSAVVPHLPALLSTSPKCLLCELPLRDVGKTALCEVWS